MVFPTEDLWIEDTHNYCCCGTYAEKMALETSLSGSKALVSQDRFGGVVGVAGDGLVFSTPMEGARNPGWEINGGF